MKRYGFLFGLILLVSVGSVQAQDASLVTDAIEAINAGDNAYFEMHAAPDMVWLDEDGHTLSGDIVGRFLEGTVMGGPGEFAATDITVRSAGDVAWAFFRYTIEEDGATAASGTGTAVFQRMDNDWKIALIHGARDVAHAH